jgi:hypothetical protein
MKQTEFNLSLLQSNSYLQLDESRKFLVSQSGKTRKKWSILPEKRGYTGTSALIKKITFGSVIVSWTSEWVTLAMGGTIRWYIDIARFGSSKTKDGGHVVAAPRLTVEAKNNNTEIILSLTGARFPGLELSADFTARLSLENGVEKMDLQFPFCGFSAQVELVKWFTGKMLAEAQVFLDDSICRITKGVNLRAGGSSNAQFNPSWLFLFYGGENLVELTTEGETINSKVLALAMLAPGMPSALPLPANRRSALFIPEKEAFNMPLWPEQTDRWRFLSLTPSFHSLAIEADERLNGEVRRAVIAIGLPADGLFFLPGADLLNDYMVPFAIPLQSPVYAAVYKGNGTRLGAALLAIRTPAPLTLHTECCSLALGPMPRKPGFMLLDIPDTPGTPGIQYLGPISGTNAPLLQGLQFKLLATALHLKEVVVDPMPPLVTNYMVLTIEPLNRPLTQGEGEISLSDSDPYARISLPDWTLTQIVRPRDLMVLGLQFLGLRPEFHGPAPGRLLRYSKEVPRIVVYFPPQSIGEQSFPEDTTKNADYVPMTINYRSAGLSRLVFNLKEGISEIPYTFKHLLNWHNGELEPRLDERAITPSPKFQKISVKQGLNKIRLAHGWFTPLIIPEGSSITSYPPELDTTAIEAPYRLLLSPDQNSYWDSKVSDVIAKNHRADLWHARLQSASTSPTPPVPIVRAIWSVDKTSGSSPDPFGKNASLTVDERDLIVKNSALKAVDANRMMLTALGAWLNLDGDWSQLPDDLVTLEKWLHRSTLGRDQFVQVVLRGYLFPFGHKAVLIKITERKFGQNPPGRVGAWLRTREFIVVKEFERNYTDDQNSHNVYDIIHNHHETREIPFRSVRLLTRITPLLDLPYQPIDTFATTTDKDAAFWPSVGKTDFLFNLNATDKNGNVVEFSAPLAFVRNDVSRNAGDVAKVISNQLDPANPENRRTYSFSGQKIVFADSLGKADEALEATSITFNGFFRQKNSGESWARAFYPTMTTAHVVVPAMRQFGNVGSSNAISFYEGYLKNGFSGTNKKGEIFAKFNDGVEISYGGGNNTDKVGGMISPEMRASALSRAHGIVGGKVGGSSISIDDQLANFADGAFNPADFFGGASAKILGGIDLFDILDPITDFTSGGNLQIPQWVNTVVDGQLTRTFKWETDKLKADAAPFASGNARKLQITCTVQVGAADLKSTIHAQLVDFTITLAEVIEIPFKEFSMDIEAGRKPEVNVNMGSVRFCGALGFISEIEDKLQLDRFVDPPSIDVTAEGLAISYGIQLPSIQVGIFALQNLALNASATLPFTGDPFRARFALSERQNPFTISVSLFAGGGFFAIGVGLDGVEMLELSLEFGGNLSLDVGVASGGVHVMAGIYIKISKDVAELTGYVRAGGSLNVLGIIYVSVELYLGLTYDSKNNKAWGEVSLRLEVGTFFFSIDVTIPVRREFAGDAADPTLEDTFTLEEWEQDYIKAFAA